jgi:hypothetical protein
LFESPESSSALKKKNMAAKSAVRAMHRDKERGRERERERHTNNRKTKHSVIGSAEQIGGQWAVTRGATNKKNRGP